MRNVIGMNVVDAIFHRGGRVCHQGFQTRENWWKHEAEGRVLLFSCFRDSSFRNSVETRSPSLWNGFSKGLNLLTINTKAERPPRKVSFCFLLFHYRMCIVVSRCYEMRCVFSQLRLSHFALASSLAILRNGRSSYRKVFPVSTAEKLQRESFFARTFKA